MAHLSQESEPMIHIFPTHRAVRSFYASFSSQDTFLPKAMSIAEFFKKALIVEGKVQAEEEMRLLLMQQAVAFDAFETLNIPQHFMAFVKNASYVFRFFEELSAEEKTIADLEGADVYAQFAEHLALLKQVYENYTHALDAQGLYDAITFPLYARVDETFIFTCKAITVHLEGYLSSFEWRVLEEMGRLVPLHVKLVATPYNEKVLQVLRARGIDLKIGEEAQIRLGGDDFSTSPCSLSAPCAKVYPLASRSLQVGFVLDCVARFLQEGLSPEEIVVVLPDEGFASLLRLYDRAYVFNYAMGKPAKELDFVVRLRAKAQDVHQATQASLHRMRRLGIEENTREAWKKQWKKPTDFHTFVALIGSFEAEENTIKEQLHEALASLERVLKIAPTLTFSEALTLFLRRLDKMRVDDVMGGPVTVMGVLETRGVHFKGVIVPDFNDDLVPHRSEKDMFLSSALRHYAGLPDKEDREQLQRYYYSRLFTQASHVAIGYVENEEKLPSRFLQALRTKKERYDESISQLLLPFVAQKSREETPVLHPHAPFEKPLSATRLKVLLTCKRRYYHRYIQHIKESPLPRDGIEAVDIGNALHGALEIACAHPEFGASEAKNQALVAHALDATFGTSASWRLEKEIWRERLGVFCANEAERHAKGWHPWKLEESLKSIFEGVHLEGKIDRIDKHLAGRLEVLDYKTGNTLKSGPKAIATMVDFQMQFYYMLASTQGEVERVGYYDLLQGVCVEEEGMEEKLAQLSDILVAYRFVESFEKTDKRAACSYCPYVHLCGRG